MNETQDSYKILIVDDQLSLIDGVKRNARKEFTIDAAICGEEAIELVKNKGPYAVVMSDMQMPGMDGIELLGQLKQIAPATTRILLTGNANLGVAINSVNNGFIFRFLEKPCEPNEYMPAFRAGIEQYQLVMTQVELLQNTLHGCIQVLGEILSLVNPEAFSRSSRIQRNVKTMAMKLNLPDIWLYEMAAMLSQIGCVILPESIMHKVHTDEPLTKDEHELYAQHPLIAFDLLQKIPRMEETARMIASQEKLYDGGGSPRDGRKGEDIPIGARILKIALDFDALQGAGVEPTEAFKQLTLREGWYDPVILEVFQFGNSTEVEYVEQSVPLDKLQPCMILAQEIRNEEGILLVPQGLETTPLLISRLKNFNKMGNIGESIQVLVPEDQVSENKTS